mgnify:CR=1 FL=1
MGYRSDVIFAVAFKNREQMEEILAVYQMDEKVRTHRVIEKWKLCPEHEPPYMVFRGDDVKWYPNYGDVQAFEHIVSVCAEFEEHRGFEFASRFVRIGEDDADIEIDDHLSDDSYDLMDFLQDCLFPVRRINCSL